ncbi:MAG: diacylglycerol kinase family protein [Bacteroidota bacterium]
MIKKHVVFIVNPRSGVDRKKTITNAIDANLDKDLYTYEILNTQFAGHGTALAKEASRNGAWAVIAVGGDGSVNDAVQGLVGTDTIFGVIPKGSGNGLARNMRVPLTTEGAIKVISSGKTVNMDIAFANGRPFISNAGVAFDALISKQFAKSRRRGLLVYGWLVTKGMWQYKPLDWQITIDGREIKEHAFMVNVANGQQFGYNFKIAPMASYTDGILDVIVIRKFPKILGAGLVYRAMNGTIVSSPYVKHYSGKEISICNPSLRLMQRDGDAHDCEHKINFTVQQGALKVLVP